MAFDLALLGETESINPYSVPIRKASTLWQEVAENLNKSNLEMKATGRNCSLRVKTLLKSFREEEAISIKA